VVLVLVVWFGVVAVAHADDKALKAYAGQIVLSPDTPPSSFDELPAFLKANATKGGSYELMKWDVNFVGVLAKSVDKVTLTVADPAKKSEALVSIELSVKRLVVVGSFKLTKAAGFETKKPYVVALTAGKTVVAKAELVLRE
jgi:hypothetical protein